MAESPLDKIDVMNARRLLRKVARDMLAWSDRRNFTALLRRNEAEGFGFQCPGAKFQIEVAIVDFWI